MHEHEFLIQNRIDPSFLSTFTRSKIDYLGHQDNQLLEAYRSGIYDAIVNFIGETNLKITGTSRTREEVKKFLRQASFNGELLLKDNKHRLMTTVQEQELLAESWFKAASPASVYTQLILMISKDNNRDKLSKIVHHFFEQHFSKFNYVYVEHTDTDIFHYHVIVGEDFANDSLLSLRANFINLSTQHGAKLL